MKTRVAERVTDTTPGSESPSRRAARSTPSESGLREAARRRTDARFQCRRIRYRDAWMDHFLCPGGVLRRYVVLDSQRLRTTLGQPRRREIEPLRARQEHFEFLTTELWEMAERDAIRSLRRLYARRAELEQAEASSEEARRLPATRVPGRLLAPTRHGGEARGILLHAGPREGVIYCIELLDEAGSVRRIEGIDLARALEASGAEIGDTVRVAPMGRHDVTIRERRTGSHGDGTWTLRRGRPTFDIMRLNDLRNAHAANDRDGRARSSA